MLNPLPQQRGHVAELADALDLGSSGEIRAGSSPVVPTNKERPRKTSFGPNIYAGLGEPGVIRAMRL